MCDSQFPVLCSDGKCARRTEDCLNSIINLDQVQGFKDPVKISLVPLAVVKKIEQLRNQPVTKPQICAAVCWDGSCRDS
jgi:hypothetical protein